MSFAAMFRDVVSGLLHRPATERYPFERRPAPKRLRGAVQWRPEGCTGCGVCVMDCPAAALELITLDKAAKRFVIRYHLDRCTFCAQCVKSCMKSCLSMSADRWELAGTDRGEFVLNYGNPEDVEQVLAGGVQPSAAKSG